MGSKGKPAANGEVLLGSENFSAEDEQFGQPGHGAGASAELLEHRQRETVLCASFVVWFQPQSQQLGVCTWRKSQCTDSHLAILSMFPGLTLDLFSLRCIDLVLATVPLPPRVQGQRAAARPSQSWEGCCHLQAWQITLPTQASAGKNMMNTETISEGTKFRWSLALNYTPADALWGGYKIDFIVGWRN